MTNPMEDWMEELLRLNDEDQKMTDKQKRIVQAAVSIFSEKGYAASSTSEIAKKAGVAEGTIFRHYKTKKDLLISVVAPLMSKLVAPFVMRDFNKVLDSSFPDYEAFVRAVLMNRREFVQQYMPVVKILLQEVAFHPELQEQFKKQVATKVFERIHQVVRGFQQEGQLIDWPTPTVIRLTVSVIIGYLIARYLFLTELDWDDDQDVEYTVQFIVRGLSK